MLERVRSELSTAADDPDLPKLFEYLIQAGVGNHSYIDDLLHLCSTMVDSKKRQLRFAAFGIAKNICSQAPWTKKLLSRGRIEANRSITFARTQKQPGEVISVMGD